uniref:E3 ISG15--protein ligase Herc6 n=1 Tax=Cacopsylla melanoneura TaxID=428564 RepID=A0A8D8QDU4_9HEMI
MKLYACGYNLNGQITQSNLATVKAPWSLLETWNSKEIPCLETKDSLVAFGFSYIATCCGNQVRIKGFDNKFNQVITLPDKEINTDDKVKTNNNHIICISAYKTKLLILQANGNIWNLNVASGMKPHEQNPIKTFKNFGSEISYEDNENLTKEKDHTDSTSILQTLHTCPDTSPKFTKSNETKSDTTLLEIDQVKHIVPSMKNSSENLDILDREKPSETVSKLKTNEPDKHAGNRTTQIESEQMKESRNSRMECQQDTESNHSEDLEAVVHNLVTDNSESKCLTNQDQQKSMFNEQFANGLSNINHLFSCELEDIRDEHLSCDHEDEPVSTDDADGSSEIELNYKKRRTKSPLPPTTLRHCTPFNRNHMKKCVSTDNIQLLLSKQGQVFHLSGRMDCFIGQVVVDIACGYDHCLALTQDGLVYSWGNGSRGQLGYPVNSCVDEDHTAGLDTADPNHAAGLDTTDPREVHALSGLGVVQVAAGGWHSVARTREGILYAWGWNNSGQLGIEDKLDQVLYDPHPVSWPEDIDPNEKDIDYQGVKIIDIACGARHTLALGEDGSVWGCGWNEYGQLGGISGSEEVPKVCTMTRLSIPDEAAVLKLCAGHWNSGLVTD